MNKTQLDLFDPDRVDYVDDPKLGYCKVYKWTKKQKRALASYQRGVDHTTNGKTWNTNPMA